MFDILVQKTLRIPTTEAVAGDGAAVTRQLDVALLSVGFTLSQEALSYYSHIHPVFVADQGKRILAAVRALVGDDKQHNVYFIDFPNHIPDTFEFWRGEIIRLLLTGTTKYGRYQHSYEEMLAHHDEFIQSAADRVTVLHLGKTLEAETLALYRQLYASTVPLSGPDRQLMKALTEACLDEPPDRNIGIRETRAIINAVRVKHHRPIYVDTLTDILRLAQALSDGDETLTTPMRFKSFPRAVRRQIIDLLEKIIVQDTFALADINQYQEQWKRLGERLHPHEYADAYPHVANAFLVARGEVKSPTLAARVEAAFTSGETLRAVALLSHKPGLFLRSVDRTLRRLDDRDDPVFLAAFQEMLPHVSARVLLGLREHLENRSSPGVARIFSNKQGRAYVMPDTLPPLRQINAMSRLLDDEIAGRLSASKHLVVERAALQIALPLSEKHLSSGFNILPRGSSLSVGDSGLLRFFVYWKQAHRRTDYDLSALFLDRNFKLLEQVSWTNLKGAAVTHSGDLTDAKDGATEFIDVDLSRIAASYIIPQINIYAGEDFEAVESCFFGLMLRDLSQRGKPFEARTVRFKSDVRGSGKVALPVVFEKKGDDWRAKWMHLYLKGQPNFNSTETNRASAGLLARMIVQRDFLTVEYIADLLWRKASNYTLYEPGDVYDHPITFIGLEAPQGLLDRSVVYTPSTLKTLIPE